MPLMEFWCSPKDEYRQLSQKTVLAFLPFIRVKRGSQLIYRQKQNTTTHLMPNPTREFNFRQ